jgi:pimeloyl-ACP methyl ester carboxylesterase
MPTAHVNGIDISYETSGSSADPCILLVHGYGAQLIQWPAELYDGLAAQGFFVVRMDNRDVGLSEKLTGQFPQLGAPEPGTFAPTLLAPPPYTLRDMADDALGLLDALGIPQAHLVGASLGGTIVQRIAIEHPERVLSLTSVMSSPGDPTLPPAAPEATAALLSPAPPDREGYVDHMAPVLAALWGPSFDEERARAQLGARHDRAYYPEGMIRQMAALVSDGDRTADLGKVTAPTLVLHGREDALVPLAHGEATTAAIPGARLIILDGMGHDLPPSHTQAMVTAIAEHARAVSGSVAG